jgi:hypothetical protein
VTSGVAAAAVCDAAARRPASDRPETTVSSGIRRLTLRAVRANLRGLPNDSTYSRPSRVTGSDSHHCSMSLLLTSYLSPTDANVDTPMPSRDSWSRSAMPTPPDCTTTPASPDVGREAANVASKPAAVFVIPRQFGPTNRIP